MAARSTTLALLLLMALLVPMQRSFAQSDYINGCDSRVEPAIAASTALDYAGGCAAVYGDCVPLNRYDKTPCRLAALDSLLASCAKDDAACRYSALLYARMMLLWDISVPPQNSEACLFCSPAATLTADEAARWPGTENLLEALTAFEAGDYEAALAVYERIDPHTYDEIQLLAFSKAVTYAAMGNNARALDAYSESINYKTDDPLSHYGRALLAAESGQSLLAAFEAEWLRTYTQTQSNEDWKALIAPLQQFSLDTAQFETWTYYPIMDFSYGSGGNVDSDLSLVTPSPVEIAFDPSGNIMILRNFGVTQSCGDGCYDAALLIQGEDGSTYHGSHQNYHNIELTRAGENFSGSAEWAWCIDSCATTTFVLTPEGAPDPRADLPGERCGVLSRLAVGMHAETARPPGYGLFDGPGGKYIPDGEDGPFGKYWFNGYFWEARIIGGGECIDDVMWWQVRTEDGSEGWTQENYDMSYLLNPIPDDASVPSWSSAANP